MNPLFDIPWNAMRDRPRIHYPYRAQVLAKAIVTNDNGVEFDARVLTNRTRNRFWIEVVRDHWLTLYMTTTSIKKRDEWIRLVQS